MTERSCGQAGTAKEPLRRYPRLTPRLLVHRETGTIGHRCRQKDYLTLLQFFLNHRRYLRSEDPSRVGKSPAELLTGQPHAHWLELLGYTRFSRN